MNDEELPMRAEMASAYLDGDLDAAERLAVEADPETMALVESFSSVRSSLAAVTVSDEATRSAAIAAALAEFDLIHAPAAVTVPARVSWLHARRMRTYRFVMGAAAAAVVVAVAVAALNSGSDSGSSSSATEAPAAQVPGAAAGAGLPTLKIETSVAAAETQTAAAGTAAPGGLTAADSALAVPAVDDVQALAAYVTARNRNAAVAGPPSTTAEPPAASSAAPAPQTPQPDFTTFAVPSCLRSSQTVLGPITVLGTPAFAVADSSTNTIEAIAAGDCHVYFAVPGP